MAPLFVEKIVEGRMREKILPVLTRLNLSLVINKELK